MPDYQGGINQPPMDQNGSISIYNTQAPSISNNGANGSSGQQGPQQGWDQPAHGTQPPDYQNATPYTQGPGRPNPDYNPGGQSNPGSQGGQPNQGVQQPAQQPQQNAGQQPDQQPDQQKIDDLTRQLQDQQQQSSQDRQRIDDMTKQLQQNKQNQKQQQSTKFPSKDKKKDDKDEQDDRDKQSGDNDLAALLMGAASTRRRKQDDQEQGPDTQALGQDASQAVQGLPGDVQTYVQSGQQIGESSGQAAQGFGSAAQAGASLASSAQSGAVNPQDAITLVQGVSQGIQGTADAVNAGSQIVRTAQGEADQVAQAVGDANPQLKPQTEQFTQLNDTVSKGTEGVGQVAGGVSQLSGAVNSVSSMGSGGLPATSGSDGTDDLSRGTATLVSGGSGTGIRTLSGSHSELKQEPDPPQPPIPPGTDVSVVPGLTNALQGQSPPPPTNPTDLLPSTEARTGETTGTSDETNGQPQAQPTTIDSKARYFKDFDDRGGNSNDRPFSERDRINRQNMRDAVDVLQKQNEALKHPPVPLTNQGSGYSGASTYYNNGYGNSRPLPTVDSQSIEENQKQIDRYNQILGHADTLILAFDPRGEGTLVQMVGAMENSTDGVGVIVPGTNSNLMGSESNWNDARNFVDAAKRHGKKISVVSWIGGEFPQGLDHAALPVYEQELAPKLRDFGTALDREIATVGAGRNPPVAFIGHSYGGAVLGEAEHLGLRADRVFYVESAGAGVDVHGPEDWHDPNSVGHRFSMTADGDLIGYEQGTLHGSDTDEMPGVTRLSPGYFHSADRGHQPGEKVEGLHSHGDVFAVDSDAFNNMLGVMNGGVALTRLDAVLAPGPLSPGPLPR
ncbi:hypothetical protein [Mycobacteroides chelonae]